MKLFKIIKNGNTINKSVKRIFKWVFLAIWIICIAAFVIGQLLAPPEYHLIPGNPWGALFGESVLIGIISFILMLLFFVLDNKREKTEKVAEEKVKNSKKYDLSLKRIISRLLLTGVIGIVFGIAMIPFLTVANGLLETQRASIGGQNILRMVALWGLFTLVVSLFAFWKKRFRMVSVLLIICWLFSIGLYLITGMFSANNYECERSTPYQMQSEFNRSLDLIAQRMGVDKTAKGTVWQSAFNYRNCLDIQYLDANDKNVEAYFEVPDAKDSRSLQDLKIWVNPSYKNFDDLTLATLISHEIVHAAHYINSVVIKTNLSCYEDEAQTYTAQYAFILSLNPEEQRSIYARLRENIDLNPTFSTIILTSQRGDEAAKACFELQKKNNLTTEQTNKCTWEGLESKLLKDIEETPYYQEQCRNR